MSKMSKGIRVNAMPSQSNVAIERMRAMIIAERALNEAVNNRFTDIAPDIMSIG